MNQKIPQSELSPSGFGSTDLNRIQIFYCETKSFGVPSEEKLSSPETSWLISQNIRLQNTINMLITCSSTDKSHVFFGPLLFGQTVFSRSHVMLDYWIIKYCGYVIAYLCFDFCRSCFYLVTRRCYCSLWSGISALRTFVSPSVLRFLPHAPLGFAAGSFWDLNHFSGG